MKLEGLIKLKEINENIAKQALNDPNFSFFESFADASETDKIRKELTRLLFLHRETRRKLEMREREKVTIAHKYDKKKREAYIKNANAANEKTRLVLVEIESEKEKYDLEVKEQLIKELTRELNSIKLEIDIIKTIGYSLKTEMGGF